MKINNIGIYINPFYLYSTILSIIIILYNFKWSNLYPNISFLSYLFFIVTILVSLILGKILNCKLPIKKNREKNPLNLGKLTLLIFLSHMIEFAYCGVIPLVEIAIKKSNFSYTSYQGIPTFHLIVVTFNSFFAVYVFNRYLIEKNKKNLFLFLVNLIPGLIIYNRGMLVLIILSCMSIYIYEKFNGILTIKSILILGIVGIVGLYLFGISGNNRSNKDYYIENSTDSSYIMMIGDATNEFRNSNIPKPFFWGYIYSTSSLANFQETVNFKGYEHKLNIQSILKCINTSGIPDYISKRLNSMFNIQYDEKYQRITPALTTAIMYTDSYVYLGWLGVILSYILFVIYIFLYRIFLDKESPFFITAISILNTVVIFNFFSNGFTFSGLNFQLIYPILFSIVLDKAYINKLKCRFKI